MKHAYLIVAHEDFEILKLLVEALDDQRNDIFIHFDEKVGNMPTMCVKKAGLYIIENRVNVAWGDVSVIDAEYRLFEAAVSTQKYTYYHLLSGVDLPLKSQDDIHDFFNKNTGKEFIGYYQGNNKNEIDRKVRRIHFFAKKFRSKAFLYRVIRAVLLRMQFLVGFRRNRKILFKKGAQWGSYTDAFVRFLLEEKERVLKIYKNSFCSDEIYKQTLCWNSKFKANIFNDEDEEEGAMRTISWKSGEMLVWTMEDYEMLVKSKFIFARKFSPQNIDVVNKLIKFIKTDK